MNALKTRLPSLLPMLLMLIAVSTINAQTTHPSTELEESAFREGLRRRGLNDWLEQYLADTPPVSAVDEQLRHRESLLSQAVAPGIGRNQRRQLVGQASQTLSKLLANHPEHPARTVWRFELARDRLEREEPAAFDAVLLYELTGRDRATVAKLSAQAIDVLHALRDEVAAEWNAFGAMDERQIAKAAAEGATRRLEQLDAQSAFLLAWAEFYQAISEETTAAQRSTRLTELIARITERYGWTVPAPGREAQRASALAMTTIAFRLTGKFPEADRAAREIVEIVPSVKDPAIRQSLNRTVLLAVLEQVRGPRDAGKFDEAKVMLEEARTWAAKTRAGDTQAELALALAEQSLLARQLAGATTRSASTPSLLTPAEALLPLQRVAVGSPAARDMLYEALAGAIGGESLTGGRSPLEVQLIAGATIADAAANADTTTQPAHDSRGLEMAAGLAAIIAAPSAPMPTEMRGELLFLQARGYYIGGAPLEAVRVLADLVEQQPLHDRAEPAAGQAAAIAQEALRANKGPNAGDTRAAFVRAGRVLRKRSPDSSAAQRLQFFIAAALDESRQYEQAAEEYAAVPANDPHGPRAAWARARCLRDALSTITASRPADDPAAKELADRALTAAKSAMEKAAAASPADPCLKAESILLLANLLDHPSIANYEEAVRILDGLDAGPGVCAAAKPAALRERVAALRQLKRMGEARSALDAYLAADPDNAGPLMARLLDAMCEEIRDNDDRGDDAAVKATAGEAEKLAERLLDWAGKHPGLLTPPETMTISVRRAWTMLAAGRAEEALAAYRQAGTTTAAAQPVDERLEVEIHLGEAECLLDTRKLDQALPMFSAVMSQVPEQSPSWWRAYVGALECHSRLKNNPGQIVQSIRQQRKLSPELGGPKWSRELKRIEEANAKAAPKP